MKQKMYPAKFSKPNLKVCINMHFNFYMHLFCQLLFQKFGTQINI